MIGTMVLTLAANVAWVFERSASSPFIDCHALRRVLCGNKTTIQWVCFTPVRACLWGFVKFASMHVYGAMCTEGPLLISAVDLPYPSSWLPRTDLDNFWRPLAYWSSTAALCVKWKPLNHTSPHPHTHCLHHSQNSTTHTIISTPAAKLFE